MSSEVNKLAFGNNTYTIADEVARQAINGLQTAIDTSKDVIVKGKDPLVINAYQDDITVSPGSYTSITVAGLGKDFTPNNIAFGKTIGLTTGVFTAYGTATAEDIAKGKVAYVKGEEIVGTLEQSSGDDSLVASILDNSITSIECDSITEVRSNCFSQCGSKLVSINFKNVTTLNPNAFNSCSYLTNVNIPKIDKLGSNCFNGCGKITNLDLSTLTQIETKALAGTSITQLILPNITSIQTQSFMNMLKVTKIDIGSNFESSLNAWAFANCIALETLILRHTGTINKLDYPDESKSPFYGSSIVKGTGYVYVPKALLTLYKANSMWEPYADQIRAIEDYPDICG